MPPTLPFSLIARDGPVFFKGRARNLAQRLDALKAVALARLPSQQEPFWIHPEVEARMTGTEVRP